MENEMDRRLFAEQVRRLFAPEYNRLLFRAQIVIDGEGHFRMPGTSYMAIVKRIRLFVIAVRQPFRVSNDLGGAIRHLPTLPSASGAGKQP